MRLDKKSVFFGLSIISIILISSLVSSGFFDPITGKATSQAVTANISVTDSSAPTITAVSAISAQTISEHSILPVTFYVTVGDVDGTDNLNATNVTANFSKAGEALRQNTSCSKVADLTSTTSNFSCIVNMWYFDGSGTWNVSVSASDTGYNIGYNTTTNFTLQQTSAFVVGPSALTWGTLSPGTTNQTSSNDPLLLNNTGNKPITSGNIQINATNLRGETTSTKAIWANNFSISTLTGGGNPDCNATVMNPGVFAGVTGASLPVGNNSVNDGSTGQEQLYACIKLVGSELTSQAYSTANEGAWTVKIV